MTHGPDMSHMSPLIPWSVSELSPMVDSYRRFASWRRQLPKGATSWSWTTTSSLWWWKFLKILLSQSGKLPGVVNCCTQPLTHEASCFNPLAGTGLSTMDEPELMCFLRTVCPELQKRKNTRKVVEILLKMQVTSLKKFKCLPKQRIDALFEALRLSAKKQKKCLDATRCKTKLPIPRVLTKPSEGCEGELQLQESKKHGTKAELFQLICRAGREMQKHGVHVWGVNPSKNHFFLKGRGDSIRKMAESNGVVQDFSSGLGLVFGAWFGFRVRHSPRFYTRQGQIKDDVERTLRYWHADKKLLRFVRYAADKHGFRPGQFSSKKGGISSNSSQQDHSTEAETAIRSLIQEFGQYVRLPKKNEKSSCGLIWSDGRISKRRKKSLVHPPSKRCRLWCVQSSLSLWNHCAVVHYVLLG